MEYYIYLKFFHVVGIVIWIGSLLGMSRMLAFHAQEEIMVQERLSWIERRGYLFVQVPGMIITILTGLGMIIVMPEIIQGSKWFHVKGLFIIILIVFDQIMWRSAKKMKQNPEKINPAKFKAFHGISALCFMIAAFFAVVKPM